MYTTILKPEKTKVKSTNPIAVFENTERRFLNGAGVPVSVRFVLVLQCQHNIQLVLTPLQAHQTEWF